MSHFEKYVENDSISHFSPQNTVSMLQYQELRFNYYESVAQTFFFHDFDYKVTMTQMQMKSISGPGIHLSPSFLTLPDNSHDLEGMYSQNKLTG